MPQARQLQGKALSYNNLNDADAALELAAEFAGGAPAVAIVKHANPCGVAQAATLIDAWNAALECDDVSAFGGIVALNTELDGETARAIAAIFTEVVIAPVVSEEARSVFAAKKNLRVLETGPLPDPRRGGFAMKSIAGGLLVQSRDAETVTRADLKMVTERAPSEAELADCMFAWTVARHVKSNAIVYAKDGATVGIGAGQMNRRDSSRIAAVKAAEAAQKHGWSEPRTVGSAVASDAFFPFADGLLAAAKGRRDGGDPAGRLDPRRGGDRRGRRGGARDGVHRNAPLSPLNDARALQPRSIPHGVSHCQLVTKWLP